MVLVPKEGRGTESDRRGSDRSVRAQPGDLRVGDFVNWRTEKGIYLGKIASIRTEGFSEVGDEEVEASPEDPVARIRVFTRTDDGFKKPIVMSLSHFPDSQKQILRRNENDKPRISMRRSSKLLKTNSKNIVKKSEAIPEKDNSWSS